jgi:hypothetical protein
MRPPGTSAGTPRRRSSRAESRASVCRYLNAERSVISRTGRSAGPTGRRNTGCPTRGSPPAEGRLPGVPSDPDEDPVRQQDRQQRQDDQASDAVCREQEPTRAVGVVDRGSGAPGAHRVRAGMLPPTLRAMRGRHDGRVMVEVARRKPGPCAAVPLQAPHQRGKSGLAAWQRCEIVTVRGLVRDTGSRSSGSGPPRVVPPRTGHRRRWITRISLRISPGEPAPFPAIALALVPCRSPPPRSCAGLSRCSDPSRFSFPWQRPRVRTSMRRFEVTFALMRSTAQTAGDTGTSGTGRCDHLAFGGRLTSLARGRPLPPTRAARPTPVPDSGGGGRSGDGREGLPEQIDRPVRPPRYVPFRRSTAAPGLPPDPSPRRSSTERGGGATRSGYSDLHR